MKELFKSAMCFTQSLGELRAYGSKDNAVYILIRNGNTLLSLSATVLNLSLKVLTLIAKETTETTCNIPN